MADPRWAETERLGSGIGARRPYFFWAEHGGEIALTAIGVRRQLPVPGRAFWEFKKGPTFVDRDVFDEWLAWLVPTLGRDAVRLRVAPSVPLDEVGDDVETILERHGFVRRRTMGTWATVCVDLARDEAELLASFRTLTRRQIKKCVKLGVTVTEEDTSEGLRILCDLQTAMRAWAPVPEMRLETLKSISRLWLAGGSGGTVLIAREDGRPAAAILALVYRERAHLSVMPSARRGDGGGKAPASYLLLWEAMRWARNRGCTVFDLGGYSLTARPDDALSGVNFFKRGFATERGPEKTVAVHEKVSSLLLEASARAARRLEESIRHEAGG
jgi:hypothetical protein